MYMAIAEHNIQVVDTYTHSHTQSHIVHQYNTILYNTIQSTAGCSYCFNIKIWSNNII